MTARLGGWGAGGLLNPPGRVRGNITADSETPGPLVRSESHAGYAQAHSSPITAPRGEGGQPPGPSATA